MLLWKLRLEANGDAASFPRIMGGTMTNMAIKPSKSKANISKPIPLYFRFL